MLSEEAPLVEPLIFMALLLCLLSYQAAELSCHDKCSATHTSYVFHLCECRQGLLTMGQKAEGCAPGTMQTQTLHATLARHMGAQGLKHSPCIWSGYGKFSLPLCDLIKFDNLCPNESHPLALV